jgi:hypothetical protein
LRGALEVHLVVELGGGVFGRIAVLEFEITGGIIILRERGGGKH